MRTIRRKLNIVPGGIPVLIKLNQYDSDYSLVFDLYSTDGVFTVPSGSTAKICGTKRSGTGYSADASISGTTVTVTGDVQMTAAAGTNVYEIVLYNGTKKLHTSNIILLVERAALDADTITDETIVPELDSLAQYVAAAQESARSAAESAAEIDFRVDAVPTQGSDNAVSSGGVWSNTLNVYQERINADNYQTYGITDITSMPTNKYVVFYTLPDNAKRITSEMVANLPSYDHAYICVLKTSPATNSYASYIAWGFTSNVGVEAVYVANGKGSASNTPWVKIWDASVNADSIAQKLDVANTSNVSLSFTERINKENVSAYGINSAVSIPANRYITFSTNPGLSTAITESDVSGLPSYSHNFLTVLKLAPVSNPYASYIAWGFSTANGIESVYTANGLGSTSNTPWVKIWEKDNNCEGHFRSSKKVSIIGDSISTFTGYVPSGYATYYPRQDVTSVDKLWWKIALDKTGMQLLKNAAWASSTVVGDDTQGAIVASSDARIADLADGDTKPDIVIVLIGTNDFGRSYSIGTFTDTDTIPTASNIADFKPAYAKMIGKIHTAYPDAKVFVCTLIPRTFSGGGYPAKNQNNESVYAFNKAVKDIAEMMNCSVIDINKDSGININNLPNLFIQESSGSYIHPLASGQALIGECVARELIKGVTL